MVRELWETTKKTSVPLMRRDEKTGQMEVTGNKLQTLQTIGEWREHAYAERDDAEKHILEMTTEMRVMAG